MSRPLISPFQRAASKTCSKQTQNRENVKSENESAGLDRRIFCSLYVPRETAPVQALAAKRFSSTSPDFSPTWPPPQPQSCTAQNHHVLIDFRTKSPENTRL